MKRPTWIEVLAAMSGPESAYLILSAVMLLLGVAVVIGGVGGSLGAW